MYVLSFCFTTRVYFIVNTTDSDFKASCMRACVSFVALLAQITPTDCTYVRTYSLYSLQASINWYLKRVNAGTHWSPSS